MARFAPLVTTQLASRAMRTIIAFVQTASSGMALIAYRVQDQVSAVKTLFNATQQSDYIVIQQPFNACKFVWKKISIHLKNSLSFNFKSCDSTYYWDNITTTCLLKKINGTECGYSIQCQTQNGLSCVANKCLYHSCFVTFEIQNCFYLNFFRSQMPN